MTTTKDFTQHRSIRTMFPNWFWRVRYRTANGGGETLVVAPHRAAAKQAIATPPDRVTAYESTEPGRRVADEVAAQSFSGYYPGVRAALSAAGSGRGGT